MKSNSIPAKFPIPWANNAGAGYINPIPVASQIGIRNGAASLTDGFPPLNFLPTGAGGVPPFGQDMNGIIKQMTAWLQWASAGGPIAYDATFQTAIGGYPNGALVASVTIPGLWWLCTVDDNTSNPDTGGAGWRRFSASGGLIATRVISATGTYTPSPGTQAIQVTVVGAGGAGGGVVALNTSEFKTGGGGGGGGYGKSRLTSGFSSVAVTIGAGGVGVAGGLGGQGGTTSFGGFISVTGGTGGTFGGNFSIPSVTAGGQGGVPSGANLIQSPGQTGGYGVGFFGTDMVSGIGGSSIIGAGANPFVSGTGPGGTATGPGGGGSGAAAIGVSTALAGGNGAAGLIIVEEYA
ncbi:hypothetical protein MesoLj131c_61840 [Mesorhizobium sp. 131-3-5]|uniref:glycine-rich domain-containing protein n=1 Tax=Mesorhizobium sp. 131-3-5 TaxID=2744520 RepID=UPI0019263CBA|nr:hypothetical protein [Mesorhizobium sp. 131-3-5]BCH11926.1 hypothetical protein MesoLj131c_61840 [Mesorhizobium sp. 131-3-5]